MSTALPLVTYWTGIWEPGREGVSKEVQDLRRALSPDSMVVSFSSGQRTSIPAHDRVLRLSARRWMLLRLIARIVEPCGQLTHVVDGISSWHLLRSLGRRPVLFTVTTPGKPLPLAIYRHVRLFAVQTEHLARLLIDSGVDRERIQILPPGVDLERFQPTQPPPMSPFRVLFASTPADAGELERRGVPLIVDVARRLPDVEFVLLWRRWGNFAAAIDALNRMNPPRNVVFRLEDAADMAAVYNSVSATICCFDDGFGKSCPTSIVEGLACGRPAIVTNTVAIADLISQSGGGAAAARNVDGIASSVTSIRTNWLNYSAAARTLAEQHFDLAAARQRYAELYRQLATPPAVSS